MNTTPNLVEVEKILKRLLPKDYGAVLFGSRAKGCARVGSDWDIGLIGPARLSGNVVENIREELDELPTLHTFDVVDFADLTDAFQATALRGAQKILLTVSLEKFTKEMAMSDENKVDLTAFETALARLEDALKQVETEWVRDAAIQRFEFTFELAWKTTMRVEQTSGLESGTWPRQVIKVAFKVGWIDDDELWLKMLDDRNRTSHTYNQMIAEEIFDRLPDYRDALTKLLEQLKKLEE
ncbi:MAG: HI0074 family nucleotidyltransferase substrate-binding subunit [Chloroflexota bacterium]